MLSENLIMGPSKIYAFRKPDYGPNVVLIWISENLIMRPLEIHALGKPDYGPNVVMIYAFRNPGHRRFKNICFQRA